MAAAPMVRKIDGPTVSFLGQQRTVSTTEEAKDIADAIRACRGLVTVQLGGNTFGLEACRAIADALKDSAASIQCALLDDMYTRRKPMEIHPSLAAFAQALQLSQNLRVLDMSDNALNPGGAAAIKPLLANCLSLEELNLNNTGVGPAGGQTIGEALAEAYKNGVTRNRPYRLKVFVLGRSRLEDPGATALASAFQAIGTLEVVRMNNNGIYPPGIVKLATALGSNPNLKYLDLTDNAVKAAGSRALADALKRCTKVEKLILETCLLRTKGGKAILEALGSNTALQELDMSYNDMWAEAVPVAVRVLGARKTLTRVAMHGNQFGDDGLAELEKGIPSTILVEVEDNDDPDSDGEESESGEEGEGEEEQEAGTEEEDEDDDDYTDDDEDEEEDDEDDDDECDPCKGLSAQMNDMFMGPDPKQAAMALKLANPASRDLAARQLLIPFKTNGKAIVRVMDASLAMTPPDLTSFLSVLKTGLVQAGSHLENALLVNMQLIKDEGRAAAADKAGVERLMRAVLKSAELGVISPTLKEAVAALGDASHLPKTPGGKSGLFKDATLGPLCAQLVAKCAQ